MRQHVHRWLALHLLQTWVRIARGH